MQECDRQVALKLMSEPQMMYYIPDVSFNLTKLSRKVG
jgi:hypothetical protein